MKIILFATVIFSLSFFLLPKLTKTLPVVHGHYIRDFYNNANNNNDKILLASEWTASGLTSPSVTQTSSCNGWFMLGGIGVLNSGGYFQRIYSGLPSHDIMYYVIYFIILDNWIATESFSIQFDSGTPASYYPLTAKTQKGSSIPSCGGSGADVHYLVEGKVFHNQSSLTLRVISGVNGNTAAFGIYSVKMLAAYKSTGEIEQSCTNFKVYGSAGTTCGCADQTYENPIGSGTCSSCNNNCDYCFGPTAGECYSCSGDELWDGSQCSSGCPTGCQICNSTTVCDVCQVTYALLPRGTCQTTCPAPYSEVTEANYRFCKSPCQANQFLYADNTCLGFCQYKTTVTRLAQFCDPCASNGFFFDNGTCLATCPTFWKQRIEYSNLYKACDYPCNDAANEFLYVNGSCLNTCGFQHRTEGTHRFCDPCPAGQSMYYNGTCLATTCGSPLQSRTDANGDYKACDHPCQDSSFFYYPKTKTCQPTCSYPYKITNDINCVYDISEEEAAKLETTKAVQSSVQNVGASIVSIVQFGSMSNPGPLLSSTFIDLLKYIRYLKITYPPKVQILLDQQSSPTDFLDPMPEFPDVLENKFPRHNLPEKFEYYELPSSFFVNFWDSLMSLILPILVLGLVSLLSHCLRKRKALHMVFEHIRSALRWNYIIAVFLSFYGDIALMTNLEMRTMQLDSVYSVISFALCILINLLAIFVFIKVILVVKTLYNSITHRAGKTSFKRFRLAQKKLKDYQVIFDSYRYGSLPQMLFLPFQTFNIYLFTSIISFLFEYPLLQASLLTVLSSVIVLYVVILKPFQGTIDFINFLFQGAGMLAINMSILILAVYDYFEIADPNSRGKVGDVIIYTNIILNGATLLYSLIGAYDTLTTLYRYIKKKCLERKSEVNKIQSEVSRKPKLENEVSGKDFSVTKMPPQKIVFSRYTKKINKMKTPKINPELEIVEKKNINDVAQGPGKAAPAGFIGNHDIVSFRKEKAEKVRNFYERQEFNSMVLGLTKNLTRNPSMRLRIPYMNARNNMEDIDPKKVLKY